MLLNPSTHVIRKCFLSSSSLLDTERSRFSVGETYFNGKRRSSSRMILRIYLELLIPLKDKLAISNTILKKLKRMKLNSKLWNYLISSCVIVLWVNSKLDLASYIFCSCISIKSLKVLQKQCLKQCLIV